MGLFDSIKSTLNELAEDVKKTLEDSGINGESFSYDGDSENPTYTKRVATSGRPVAPAMSSAPAKPATPPPAPAGSMPPPPPAMPKISYYAMVNGQQQGPLDATQFDRLVKSKQITPDSFVWTDGMAEWAKASSVGELGCFFRPTMPPPPPGSVPPPPPGAQRKGNGMFSAELEQIVEAAIADGALTPKERAVLQRRAMAEGIDPDEFEVILEGRLTKAKQQGEQSRPAPQANNGKYGVVQKCPSCGAQVVGGTAFCKECGYNFAGVNANSSAERLSAKLIELSEKENNKSLKSAVTSIILGETADPKVILIETFPVPNTRADLLEFLTSIQPKAIKPTFWTKSDPAKQMSFAYWKLYGNCINKARISYADDPDFKFFFADFDKRK